MTEKTLSYIERTAKFLQSIKIGEKVFFVLSITVGLVLPLVFIEDMNLVIHKILFIFAVISAFSSGIAVFGYIMYLLFLKKYLDTANTILETTSNAIDTVSKVKEVHKLIKMPSFTKAKEFISRIKGFKMPKIEIKNKFSKLKFWKKGVNDV